MCRELNVSEQGYYAWRKRQPSKRQQSDIVISERINKIHSSLNANPGRRRIHAELMALGMCVSLKRVHRLMTALGLQGRHPKAWRTTTNRDGRGDHLGDLLKQDFAAPAANVKWCGDITYIKTWQGWAYLATVIDLHSRKLVGWALSDTMKTPLITEALDNALARQKPGSTVIFHSDQGSQYSSRSFTRYCQENNITRSMGRIGTCYDNAVAESFFATYKKELIHTRPWPTIAKLRKETFNWIENYYNTKRRHSTLKYLTPVEYELGYRQVKEIYNHAA